MAQPGTRAKQNSTKIWPASRGHPSCSHFSNMSKPAMRSRIGGFLCALISTAGCSERSDQSISLVADAARPPSEICMPSSDAGSNDASLPVGGRDPLVGTWIFTGNVPARVTSALSINPDGTFTCVEQVAPATLPAGAGQIPCVTTLAFSAKYIETVIDGMDTLMWTFVSGTANAVTGCRSNNSSGTPMTAEGVVSLIAQGIILPTRVAYSASSETLVFNPMATGGGFNRTEFIKIIE
jgi:hypothetical protein